MKKLITTLFNILMVTQVVGQSTTDIIIDAEFNNPTNNSVIRVIQEGEIISNNSGSYEYQMLAIYDVIPSKHVVKIEDQWLVEVPPNSTVPISVKCRCLNEGLKIPQADDLAPTGFQFNQGRDMESQDTTWKIVERSKGIIQYKVMATATNNDCIEAVKAAVKALLKKHEINASFSNIDNLIAKKINCQSISNNLEFDLFTTPSKIPVRVINLQVEINNSYEARVTGDIYIEPKYHKFFGR